MTASQTETLRTRTERNSPRMPSSGQGRAREPSALDSPLVGTVAHELRVPLTPVRIQLHLLRSRLAPGQDPDAEKSFQILERNLRRFEQLISDLLDLSRLGQQKLPLHPRPTELAPILAEAVEMFQADAQRKGVHLDLDEAAVEPVMADPQRLTQVLLNLISNALKFTPAGGRILIRCAQEQGIVRIDVADTGQGLTEEQCGRLFEPFSRPHESSGANVPGSGLGLHICRQLIVAHGGRIWATSNGPGQGTTIAFTLPGPGAPVRNDQAYA